MEFSNNLVYFGCAQCVTKKKRISEKYADIEEND